MVKILPGALLGFLLLYGVHNGYAQDSTSTKTVDTGSKFPRAILVQISSEHNRIAALADARRFKEMEMVKEDVAMIMAKTIADFKDHFTFCPFYYYTDTNIDLIKNRKFAGVLFNADGTPATNTGLSDTSKNYLIVYYGYPKYQSRTTDSLTENPINYNYNSGETLNRGTNNYLIEQYGYPAYHTKITDSAANKDDDGYGSQEPFGKGLVINNYRLQQVSYMYKLGYDNFLFRIFPANRPYIYVSKHFDMEYFPIAPRLNEKLVSLNKKIRISHYPGGDMPALFLGKKIN